MEEIEKKRKEIQDFNNKETKGFVDLIQKEQERIQIATKHLEDREKKFESMRDTANLANISDPVTLNVGGKKFTTSLSTLTSKQGTFFETMFNGSLKPIPMKGKTNTFFIDRDPKYIGEFLNYLRGKSITPPTDPKESIDFYEEVDFFNMGIEKVVINNGNFQDSKILSFEQNKALSSWLPDVEKWRLIFNSKISRSSITSQFRTACENKGPTVVILKSGNNVFGGYNDSSWSLNVQHPYFNTLTPSQSKSFLFSLKNFHGTQPVMFPAKPNTNQLLYSDHNNLFGFGQDLLVTGNLRSCSTNLGQSFTNSTGFATLFCGSPTFHVEEIEVYN